MKKLIFTFLLTLFCAVASFAQSTIVSGTVTDAGSQAWANGKYTFTFQPNPQYPTSQYTWTGGTLNNVISGTLDGSGSYSVSIPSNSAITPAGSTWILQVTPDATSQSFSTPRTTITGGTQTLNVTPPVILISWSLPPGPAISAYTDSEIGGPLPKGAEYFNVTSNLTRVWNGTTWNNQGGGGGGGACPNGAANDIQSTDGTSCVGDPSFTWNGSTKSLLVFGNGTTSQTLICGDNGSGFPGCISGLSIDDIGNQVTVGDNEAGGSTVVEGDAEAQVISNTVVALTAPTITATSTLQTSISTGNNSVVTDHINGVSITAAGASANTIAEVSTLGAITRSAPTITDAVGTASPVTPGSVLQRSVTTTTDTILSSDRGNRVVYNSASAVAATLPPNGSAGFAGGFNVRLSNQNAGTVTITPSSGTINGNANLALLEGQDCFVTPSSTGTNYAADCNEPQITAGTGITLTRAVHGLTINATASGTPSFSTISSGTNTTAAMVLGTGSSLTVSGSGTNNATTLGGATFAAPGPIGSTTPSTGAFTTLSATGQGNFSGAGAASSASVNFTGTVFTGGSGTTTFPNVYLNYGTAPTTWSTNGTILGLNGPSAFSGNYIDIHTNGGTSIFSVSSNAGGVTSSGAISAGTTLTAGTNASVGATGAYIFTGRSKCLSGADGRLNCEANAGGALTRFTFGAETTSLPAFTMSGTNINTTLGDGSAGGTLTAGNIAAMSACGTTSTCGNTAVASNAKIIYGSAPLVSGTPSAVTISGISPAFTSSTSYKCTVSDQTAVTTALFSVTYVSGSSFTITGGTALTDTVGYICAGN